MHTPETHIPGWVAEPLHSASQLQAAVQAKQSVELENSNLRGKVEVLSDGLREARSQVTDGTSTAQNQLAKIHALSAHVDALKAYNRALAATAAEEHS